MANIEELETLRIFHRIPFTFPQKIPVTLFNWKKIMIVFWGAQCMFFVAIGGLVKPVWDAFTKACIFTAIVTPFMGYLVVLLNMFSGGWGREESRFWCNLRIMFLSGYNTIRWCIASVVDPCIVMAASKTMGEDTVTSIWAGVAVAHTYYILATIEQMKAQPIDWEKYKNDFDVNLSQVNDIQKKNVRNVNVNPILVCMALTVIPWTATGWAIGFVIMAYQLCMCLNAYMYANSTTTFVVTDIQYDIIQALFRISISWSFIFLC